MRPPHFSPTFVFLRPDNTSLRLRGVFIYALEETSKGCTVLHVRSPSIGRIPPDAPPVTFLVKGYPGELQKQIEAAELRAWKKLEDHNAQQEAIFAGRALVPGSSGEAS